MAHKRICNHLIIYSFYALFFVVPLIFTSDNSELFELTKMWVTWGLTATIVAAWISKMILTKSFRIQKTPLDIPLLLFLSSQIIATVFSLDHRISFWGYYSRFNGGLLSTITYVMLYYAFVTNLNKKHIYRILAISLITALLVCLWGFPSHFGIDPTCYVVRGSFDISCWTQDFVPTVRVFSTLGQPAWFASYVSILLPVAIAMYLLKVDEGTGEKKVFSFATFKKLPLLSYGYIFLIALLYTCLTFSNTRAGVLGFLFGNLFFWIVLFILFRKKLKYILTLFALCTILFLICNFIFGVTFQPLQRFSIGYKLQDAIVQQTTPKKPDPATPTPTPQSTTAPDAAKSKQIEAGVANITDSGNIRQNVWRGAIDAWKASPIFGTGVETFAFAYYQHKPIEQNSTSEWDFLYNKAHNEYLNYLATTGLYGLATYLLFLGWFGFLLVKYFYKKSAPLSKDQLLVIGMTAGFMTMLFSNFFGFSVVIVNLYLFLIPAFCFTLLDMLQKPIKNDTPLPHSNKPHMQNSKYEIPSPSLLGWGIITLTWLTCFYLIYLLFAFWNADKAYSLGYNLDRVGQYQQAYPKLLEAYNARKSEPVFQDELAYNSAVLATGFASQKDDKDAQTMQQQAVNLSDQIIAAHPNNIVFLKNRVRMLYELSKLNPQYIGQALQTILRAYELAPNDAKIAYNAGVLLGQTGQVPQGIDVLERAARLKPDFRDVHFALGLFYHDQATKGGKTVVDKDAEQKAEDHLHFILEKINPNDKQTQDMLASWNVAK